MKITFKCNNGANIHSVRKETWDLSNEKHVRNFGYSKEEWLELSEEEKNEICTEWANESMEIYYEETE